MEIILAFICMVCAGCFYCYSVFKDEKFFISTNLSFSLHILDFKQAGQTAGFVDPCLHSQSSVSGQIFNLTGSCLCTNISRWYYSLCGSSGISCSNCKAVSPSHPSQCLLRCWGNCSKRHSDGTSTIRSPAFSVPFLPAGLSSRICLIKIPLMTSPLLRRLPIPRPPTMLIPNDLLGSLQSSTLL